MAPVHPVAAARPTTLARRAVRVLAVAVLVVVVAACDRRFTVPEGAAPLRYRDQIVDSYVKVTDATYGRAKKQDGTTIDLKLDVYLPKGDKVKKRPAIVWVHGGSFRGGSKTSPEIVDQATTFAKKGYVTFSISYRLSKNGCVTVSSECITAIGDAKHDAQAAVRYVRANATKYGVDTGRIAMGGTSAGAITALNVGYGAEDVGTSGNPGFSSTIRSAVSLSGAHLVTQPNAGDASALLFHGTADQVVPYSWATRTVDAARAAGLDVELTTWEGAGHVPWTQHRTEILDQTTNWLYWALDLASAPT